MSRASSLESLLAALALSGATAPALAQNDLTLPPRVGDNPAPAARRDPSPAATPAAGDSAERRPGGAALAPQPKARENSLEEVIVVGGGQWRLPELPDLGSGWRQAHARNKESGRIHVGFTALYDPGESPTSNDVFLTNREIRRVGFLQLFQVHFGGGHR